MYSKTTIQHILSNGLFHGVEHLRTLCLLLLMVVAGAAEGWAQDPSQEVEVTLHFSAEAMNFGGGKEATVAPYISSVDASTPDGMKAYIISRVFPSVHSAILSEVAYIPQDVPILLLDFNAEPKTGDTEMTLTVISDFEELDVNTDDDPDNDIEPITESIATSNCLKVSDGTVEVNDAQVYMYYEDEFILTTAGTILEGYFYLDNPNYQASAPSAIPAGSNFLQLVLDDLTGIVELKDSKIKERKSDTWYSLDGRRLTGKPVRKGIYINNGRKKVVM